MAVDERRRLDAYRDLAAVIGDDATRTVFELLDQPTPDPAARGELADLRGAVAALGDQLRELSAQVAQLASRMERQFEQVDARFEQVDARFEQVDARFERVEERSHDLRAHVDVRIDGLRDELTATFERGLREAVVGQTRIIVFSLVAAFAAVSGVAIGVLG